MPALAPSTATELSTRFADQLAELKARSDVLQVNENAEFFYVHFSPGTLRVTKVTEDNPRGGLALAWTSPGGSEHGGYYVDLGEATRNAVRMKALVDFAWIVGKELGLSIK